MNFTADQIKEAYNKSNPKIRKILDSNWITTIAASLGRDFNLRIDKVNLMIHLIGLVLLGLISIDDFINKLEEELEISRPNAVALAKKIDELIFKKIREIVLNKDDDNVIEKLNLSDNNDNVRSLIKDIETNSYDDELSFKERFNKVVVKKEEKKYVDPYREPID